MLRSDGKLVIENIKPKAYVGVAGKGGVYKVINEKINNTAQYKETEEGKIGV